MKHLFILLLSVSVSSAYARETLKIIANPLNLNYRFMTDEPSRREAADPVIELFKGKYYLFASKSGGYWSSPNLADWTYIPCKTISTIENYAPTVLALSDTLYYLSSGSKIIYYTTNPDEDDWKALEKNQYEFTDTDPAFFHDNETGKVYVYFGCSNRDPIKGTELLPAQGFKSASEPVVLIDHHTDIYGWEIPGEKNEKNETGWNEGATMLKYNGKYYLQYASPGTQYRTYADGVYVGDHPLGPFKYMENSPFSIKPGGFIGGAGHGHTFCDKYGNYWHVATMKISQRHSFERRLGLFPVYFGEGTMYAHTVWTDYPFLVPAKKVDFASNDLSMHWNILSYNKKVFASSYLPDFEPEKATNEDIENWWSAKTGNAGEWWQVDLGEKMTVNAVQVNFADHDFTNRAGNSFVCYQYRIEFSDNGIDWKMFADRMKNTKDMPHELVVSEKPVKTRFLRITNTQTVNGKFSLSGFRVFGKGTKKALSGKISGLNVRREADRRHFSLTWDKQPQATGYIVRWGVIPDRLNNAVMVFDNVFEAGYFNRDSEYYFSVSAFNENGH
ncbi:MAG: family 43 glycosylhydrolase [Tannerella sp.]|jgi:hypothetical protein|nr:family 43 glycosylhydrolase [Tannerella sp.]